MFSVRKTRWLILLMAMVLLLGALAGCGGSSDPNGEEDPGDGSQDPEGNEGPQDPGAEDQGEEFDMGMFYGLEFKGTEFYKVDLWQKVDGEETSGWISVALSQGEDEGSYTVEYEGVFGDDEFSETKDFVTSSGGITFNLKSVLVEKVSSYQYFQIWERLNWPALEYFEGFELNRVGEKIVDSFLGYEVEAVGYNTYGGQEGLTLTAETDGLIYEVCLSTDVPFNLYVYDYDKERGEEYKATLVEFSD